ncbi:MAG: hypothetical protein JJ913_14185 [Rhizobiaceae bacterium]|nr:hypothetical protein [Rhizobiaceae bacterium]
MRFSSLARSRSGNFATLTALTAPVAIVLAALAIDEGALLLEKRRLQSLADIAAIAAAAELGDARNAAAAALDANGYSRIPASESVDDALAQAITEGSGSGVRVITGIYSPDPALAPAERFAAGKNPPNAVRVSIRHPGTRYFSASFFAVPTIAASAVAAVRPEAAFSIGSRLARVDGGLANSILGGLTGSRLSLSVMDYEALLSADISLIGLLQQLATDLALDAFSYNDVIAASASVGEILTAAAGVERFDAATAIALRRLASQLDADAEPIPLTRLFTLGSLGNLPLGYSNSGSGPRLGLMELFSAAAALSAANGRRQIELDLGASVDGLAEISAALAIGEPAQHYSWFGIGGSGAVLRTAQTRLSLNIGLGHPARLPGIAVTLPLQLEIAYAEARLSGIACPNGPASQPRVAIAARPGIARVWIAERRDGAAPTAPAQLVSTRVLKVSGRAYNEIANGVPQTLNFDRRDIDQGTVKRVATTELADSLTRTLLNDLDLDVQVAGLGFGLPSGISAAVTGAISGAAPAIDALIEKLLTTLGIHLGEADVRVHNATCGRAVLVQ